MVILYIITTSYIIYVSGSLIEIFSKRTGKKFGTKKILGKWKKILVDFLQKYTLEKYFLLLSYQEGPTNLLRLF